MHDRKVKGQISQGGQHRTTLSWMYIVNCTREQHTTFQRLRDKYCVVQSKAA